MRQAAIGIALLALLSVSCGQRGKHAVAGMGTVPIDDTAVIEWWDGPPLASFGYATDEPSERLLTVLMINPEAIGSSSGGSAGSGVWVAHYKSYLGSGANRVEFSFEFDKQEETVKIEGESYDRTKGNLFVIIKSPSTEARVWQLTGGPNNQRDAAVLAEVKRELPDVKVVQDLNPYWANR